MNQERDLMEAYARLKALHDNIPERANRMIEKRYVDEFEAIRAFLQKHSSFDLSRFAVPASAIVDVSASVPDLTISAGTWYDLHFVKAKIEGLLTFFELQWSEPRPRIGFRPQ